MTVDFLFEDYKTKLDYLRQQVPTACGADFTSS